MTDYFIEIDRLNLYAQLDPEAFPCLLKANLNPELRKAIAGHKPKPTNYADWRELALEIGGEQEAEVSVAKGKAAASSRPGPTSSTKSQLVPAEEKDRRRAAGDCIKCGKTGHLARECRSRWKYEASQPAVKIIEGKKRLREDNRGTGRPQKKRLADQTDGSIRTITSRIDDLGPAQPGKE